MSNRIACVYCGRFIGHREFEAGEVSFHFVPDSEFTQEQIDHYHIKCREKDDPSFIPLAKRSSATS